MNDDVCAELREAKALIALGDFAGAIGAITAAEKAWQIEVDCWAQELYFAEREINSRD